MWHIITSIIFLLSILSLSGGIFLAPDLKIMKICSYLSGNIILLLKATTMFILVLEVKYHEQKRL
ncbi:hypothetical protein AXX12_04505 [Anaerosporomusa subterranea]|uniref:Uncharacterized protein n=1 Tax=Anaerosporomusa subterranea TaxID=1794912 RepID=A0A154BU39_ANASB|nr:hypothetical protein AXX12_04505 [Anaerosporomusa subterranea]